MAGHRPSEGVLTTDMEPYPINPYGVSKLEVERMRRSAHVRHGLSVICFRIGYVQRGDNNPGTHMGWGVGDRRCGCPTATCATRWSGQC
jgi:NAD+ dependent glucose-6-phosphate dehydrogenase